MNIAFLIGNGFDIAQGAKTRYKDFYEIFKNESPINDLEAKMIAEIRGADVETWADMEVRLGQFAANASEPDEFQEFYYHLISSLHGYLKQEQNKLTILQSDKYIADMRVPWQYLNQTEMQLVVSYLNAFSVEPFVANVISYNYTDILEKTLGYKDSPISVKPYYSSSPSYQFEKIYKIHGCIDGTPILGVNDASQIANDAFAKNPDVTDFLVKPDSNKVLGTRVDEFCRKVLREAQLIVLHGVSMGDTDNMWWSCVGENCLKNQTTRVLIFYHDEENYDNLHATLVGRKKREIRSMFFDKCGIPKEKRKEIESRVFPIINSGFLAPKKGS